MMVQLDLLAMKQRYEDIQREAQEAHRAARIARLNGNPSLISRMAKLLANFGRRLPQAAQPKAAAQTNVSQHRLASVKPR